MHPFRLFLRYYLTMLGNPICYILTAFLWPSNFYENIIAPLLIFTPFTGLLFVGLLYVLCLCILFKRYSLIDLVRALSDRGHLVPSLVLLCIVFPMMMAATIGDPRATAGFGFLLIPVLMLFIAIYIFNFFRSVSVLKSFSTEDAA